MGDTPLTDERDGTVGTDDLPQSRLTVPDEIDAKEFFTDDDGTPTLVNHADLESTVPNEEKEHLHELERVWLNKPFAFAVIYEDLSEQKRRYYTVEPVLSETEQQLVSFLKEKLEFAIDVSTMPTDTSVTQKAKIIREQSLSLMERYDLIKQDIGDGGNGILTKTKGGIIRLLRKQAQKQALDDEQVDPVPVSRDPETGERQKLNDDQIEKIIYYLIRDFVRFGKIDPFKQDPNIEDISCNGYHKPIFVYHSQHGTMITNVRFGEGELDDFVIEMAQSAGKGISKRNPNVGATLADGSRAQLELGREVSDFGTNFTIRQFKEIPFTPIDLISWQTFSLEEITYLWLAIENNKSIVVSGGTASGKTTTMNALSLCIDSGSKIVSLEDTRELLLPHRNWVAETTRESFREDDNSEIGMFQLLKDALRKRPDYILMGEIRGEEAQTLFQAMNTGHTVATTFHANNPGEVVTRFVEDPLNVSRTMVGSIDLILSQTQTRRGGQPVRRCTNILEMYGYNSDTEEYDIDRTFYWNNETDTHIRKIGGQSQLMSEVRKQRGWSTDEFQQEWQRRKIVLSYLIKHELNSYAAVASVLSAYMSSPRSIMELIANDELADRLTNLQSMKTIDVQVDPGVEALVPRPEPGQEVLSEVDDVLSNATNILAEYESDQSEFASSIDEYIPGPDESKAGPPNQEPPTEPTDGAGLSDPEAETSDPSESIADWKSPASENAKPNATTTAAESQSEQAQDKETNQPFRPAFDSTAETQTGAVAGMPENDGSIDTGKDGEPDDSQLDAIIKETEDEEVGQSELHSSGDSDESKDGKVNTVAPDQISTNGDLADEKELPPADHADHENQQTTDIQPRDSDQHGQESEADEDIIVEEPKSNQDSSSDIEESSDDKRSTEPEPEEKHTDAGESESAGESKKSIVPTSTVETDPETGTEPAEETDSVESAATKDTDDDETKSAEITDHEDRTDATDPIKPTDELKQDQTAAPIGRDERGEETDASNPDPLSTETDKQEDTVGAEQDDDIAGAEAGLFEEPEGKTGSESGDDTMRIDESEPGDQSTADTGTESTGDTNRGTDQELTEEEEPTEDTDETEETDSAEDGEDNTGTATTEDAGSTKDPESADETDIATAGVSADTPESKGTVDQESLGKMNTSGGSKPEDENIVPSKPTSTEESEDVIIPEPPAGNEAASEPGSDDDTSSIVETEQSTKAESTDSAEQSKMSDSGEQEQDSAGTGGFLSKVKGFLVREGDNQSSEEESNAESTGGKVSDTGTQESTAQESDPTEEERSSEAQIAGETEEQKEEQTETASPAEDSAGSDVKEELSVDFSLGVDINQSESGGEEKNRE